MAVDVPVALVKWEAVLGDLLDRTLRFPKAVRFTFLGFRIWADTLRLDGARARRFRRRVRAVEAALERGVTDEEAAQRRLSSLVGHAEGAHTLGLRRSFFARRG